MNHYDVIVIGAGSAGCVMAARLSEDPACRVLLLEAGPDYPTRNRLPLDIADGTRLTEGDHDWGLVSAGSNGVCPMRLPRGKLVGGCSAINGTFAMRGRPEDHDAWEAAGNPGWGFDALLPYYRALEGDLDFGHHPWHGDAGPVPIRRYPVEEQSLASRAFLETAIQCGHPALADHNEPGTAGAGPLPVNTLNGLRMSAAQTHLAEARQRPNLTVRGGSEVDRVLLKQGRAVGVRLCGGEDILAERTVLSAGAYASPAILMRSGIGPADHLREYGIRVRADLPGVGQNLQDHVLLALYAPVAREPVVRPHYQNMVTWRSDGKTGPPDLHLFAWGPTPLPGGAEGEQQLAVSIGLLDPHSRGELRLASSSPADGPRIDSALLAHPDDVRRFAAGVREARRLMRSGPLAERCLGPEITPGEDLPDAKLERILPRIVRTYFHPAGTCRMGPNTAAGAVVDHLGRVHGMDNLVVADASIMPTVPRANTHLPTMVVAERIADCLFRNTATAAGDRLSQAVIGKAPL
jgi:choline dehydrogenase